MINLQNAIRQFDAEVEAEAALLIEAGMPVWMAMERALATVATRRAYAAKVTP